MTEEIGVVEIEAAINYWRQLKPSPNGFTLAPEIRALAEVYGLMAYQRASRVVAGAVPALAMAAIEGYRMDRERQRGAAVAGLIGEAA